MRTHRSSFNFRCSAVKIKCEAHRAQNCVATCGTGATTICSQMSQTLRHDKLNSYLNVLFQGEMLRHNNRCDKLVYQLENCSQERAHAEKDVLASFPCASQRPNANSWLAKQDVPRGTRYPRTQSPASVQTPIRFHYDLFHHTLREALLHELLHHLRKWSVNNLCDSSLLDSVSRQSLAIPPTALPSAAKIRFHYDLYLPKLRKVMWQRDFSARWRINQLLVDPLLHPCGNKVTTSPISRKF